MVSMYPSGKPELILQTASTGYGMPTIMDVTIYAQGLLLHTPGILNIMPTLMILIIRLKLITQD